LVFDPSTDRLPSMRSTARQSLCTTALTLSLISVLPRVGAAAHANATELNTVVMQTVRTHYTRLHACYRRALAEDRSRGGTIFVRLTLGRGNRVQQTHIERDEIGHPEMARCIEQQTLRWTIKGAAHSGATAGSELLVPLTFKPVPGQYAVAVADVRAKQVGEGHTIRPVLTAKNAGADKATMQLHDLLTETTLAAGTAQEHALLVLAGHGRLIGARHRRLQPDTAIWIPANNTVRIAPSHAGLRLLDVVIAYQPPRRPPAKEAVRVIQRAGTSAKHLAGGKLQVTPLLYNKTLGHSRFYLGIIRAERGAVMKPHLHAQEAELLFVRHGEAPMKAGDLGCHVRGQQALYLPPQKQHEARVTRPLEAVQVYVPAGPERRYFKP